MTEKAKHRVPAGVGAPGRALWRRLVNVYEFEEHELALLEVAARQADDVAALEALIADQGMTVAGSGTTAPERRRGGGAARPSSCSAHGRC